MGGRIVITEKLTVGSLAAVLHEPEHKALARVLKVLGEQRCVELLAEALLCEHQGGMLTKDGRKRTLGGVFLTLCRQRSTPEQKRAIFQ
jgi:PHAX RNA-binding domain